MKLKEKKLTLKEKKALKVITSLSGMFKVDYRENKHRIKEKNGLYYIAG